MSSLDAMRARFVRNEGLPFADILTAASIREVLKDRVLSASVPETFEGCASVTVFRIAEDSPCLGRSCQYPHRLLA